MDAGSRVNTRRRVLITGIAGQDGSYLTESLLADDYDVYGVVRRTTPSALANLLHLGDRISLIECDLLDPGAPERAIESVCPHEIYHLAGPAFVPDSWEHPAKTIAAITGLTASILESARSLTTSPRVLVASSREIFGATSTSPQTELTPAHPTTPYGVAKAAAHQLVGLLRERDDLHASSAIFYNHESPRRPSRYVTRKVTLAAAAAKLGLDVDLRLGDIRAVRDWSAATDFVRAARLMVGQDEPGDYVLASGTGRTVEELVQTAFSVVEMDAQEHLRVDETLLRDREAAAPVGDASKARERLGWRPEVSFDELIRGMVESDIRLLSL